MKRYIIEYRGEFSTVIEAESSEDAIAKAEKLSGVIEWEPVGELHSDYFEDVSDHPFYECDCGNPVEADGEQCQECIEE